MNQAATVAPCLLPLLACLSCRSLDRFDTQHGEAYCGSLVGQKEIALGFAEPGWRGTEVQSTLALTLRTAELFKDKEGGIPAVVTSNDATFGPCASEQKPLFDKARARTIGRALGDRLSSMHLGEDHEEDVVTFIDSTCSGSMVAILSLVQNGTVELRLLRPAPVAESPDTEGYVAPSQEDTQRFGLFQLTKKKEGCVF